MIVHRLYQDHLAQASYLIGCAATGEAIIIDPIRDSGLYLDAAREAGLRITAVAETHIHADFVSGSRALAAAAGATLYLSGEGGDDWQYSFASDSNVRLIRGGASIAIGNLRLDALHTPGHTPEHLTFLLTDLPASPEPYAAFTGDFLFAGDVGRPDLLERAAGHEGVMIPAARTLWKSLQRFAGLPGHLVIWPGHGAGSACGKQIGGVPVSTLGYEKKSNWAFRLSNEQEFVGAVLSGQPEPPRYFAEMKRVNKLGPPAPAAAPPPEIAFASIDPDTWILDLAACGAPRAIHMPLGKQFLTWTGSIVPPGSTIALVGTPAQAAEAARLLPLIGYDAIAGYAPPPASCAPSPWIGPTELPARLASGEILIDVRGASEREGGAIPGSLHIPLGQLPETVPGFDRATPVIVHCQGGARSPIAATLLRRLGFANVTDLRGGYAAWSKQPAPAGAVR